MITKTQLEHQERNGTFAIHITKGTLKKRFRTPSYWDRTFCYRNRFPGLNQLGRKKSVQMCVKMLQLRDSSEMLLFFSHISGINSKNSQQQVFSPFSTALVHRLFCQGKGTEKNPPSLLIQNPIYPELWTNVSTGSPRHITVHFVTLES